MSCPSGDAEVKVTFNPSFHGTGFSSWCHFRAVACEILVFQVPLSVVRAQPLCQDYLQQQGHQVYPSLAMPCPSIRMGTETIRRDGPGGALPAAVAGHQGRARLLLQLFRTGAASAP